MLSDEEKKAIEVIKSLGISIYDGKSQIIHADTTKEISTAIYTTINLIEKQSKEIEEYKKQLDLDYVDKHFVPIERYNQLEKEIEELKKDSCCMTNCVRRDKEKLFLEEKIKAKIEEVSDGTYDAKLVLQSLLKKEDNNE